MVDTCALEINKLLKLLLNRQIIMYQETVVAVCQWLLIVSCCL